MNTEKLKKKIEESGYKSVYIANQMGITAQALLNKLHGKSEFKISEIQILKKLLALSADETHEIFLI